MQYTRSSLLKQLQQSDNGRILLRIMQKIKNSILTVWDFVRSHKNMMTIMIPITIITVGILLYFLIRIVILHYQLANNVEKLYQTSTYDTQIIA